MAELIVILSVALVAFYTVMALRGIPTRMYWVKSFFSFIVFIGALIWIFGMAMWMVWLYPVALERLAELPQSVIQAGGWVDVKELMSLTYLVTVILILFASMVYIPKILSWKLSEEEQGWLDAGRSKNRKWRAEHKMGWVDKLTDRFIKA